ncbi:MAG: 3-dehydroquinate synthase [Lachnospiraceae bacterium]|nr:3-dehydroquinate synthase [Lachnospiraceae bacterium]
MSENMEAGMNRTAAARENAQVIKGKVTVSTGHGIYDVVIGQKLDFGRLLRNMPRFKEKACKILLVTEDSVDDLYGEMVKKNLESAGFEVRYAIFDHGEESKCLLTLEYLLERSADVGLTKSDIYVALGGGVVGDIAGFASAVYLRGIDFIQIPTTILAAVDSSVGGKTAIDLEMGKNLVGAFHQPLGVFLDTDFFDTLPDETKSEGLAEAIKYGMIRDASLLDEFEKDDPDIVEICRRCIQIKADVVHIDELDQGLRKILNFGHTPAHSIENLSKYRTSHGNAVAIGMVIMTKLSEKLGKLPANDASDRLLRILKRYNLPVSTGYTAAELAEVAKLDKKREGDDISLVLLDKVGEAVVEKYPVEELERLFAEGMESRVMQHVRRGDPGNSKNSQESVPWI